ncbi:hypothetical protein KUTeg_019220 [Tegillarca granosa]|uniref:Uncharacterized protein n=1 Tax=Tegillarca granosa TaxID=220873 RepID=A0ABQ9EBW3_TEGGR|nr:hypothetical protein KUTeg_019220 [Tegillarca granosa]
MEVLSPLVHLEFGTKTEISIQPTVPFGCSFLPTGGINNCFIDIEMFIPKSNTCTGHIGQLSTNLKDCGTRITRDNWNDVSTLTVAWQNDETYIENGMHHVGLKVNRKNSLWNFALPVVKMSDNFQNTNLYLNINEL